jgi:hypothetical protein
VRALLGVLESVYPMEDIESIVTKAGLRMGDVAVSARSALTWRSVYDLAAGNLAVDALLEEVAAFRPALRLRIDELRVAAADLRPGTLAATRRCDPWRRGSTSRRMSAGSLATSCRWRATSGRSPTIGR